MEQSPLSQDARPDKFKAKVVQSYEHLFGDGKCDLSEGFWREFFLLKPDKSCLQELLGALSSAELLARQNTSQQLFAHAVKYIKASQAPVDELALVTLTVFLENVLNKRYTHPSSDIISILTGLDGVDTFGDLVAVLDTTIRSGRNLAIRLKAVQLANVTVASAYKTSLVSYFINRDLFPALIKLMQDAEQPRQCLEAFNLLGILVNYNKFEFRNPYKLRLEDFVNEGAIRKLVANLGAAFELTTISYVSVQNDDSVEWSFGGTLSYIGFGSKKPAAVMSPEDVKAAFAMLPPPDISALLATYDFAYANKFFCSNFVTCTNEDQRSHSTFSYFLSATSYLLHHAHSSARTSLYACLSLMILQVCSEDSTILHFLCSIESRTTVRLCRQKPPNLPSVRGARPAIAFILDMLVDGINHNLSRRLDTDLHTLILNILLRIMSHLDKSRTRLSYNYSYLWRSILLLARFLTTQASALSHLAGLPHLAALLTSVLAFALTAGNAFLPDANAYDDLVYKVFEAGDVLIRFKAEYSSAANTLIVPLKVHEHYHTLLQKHQEGRSAGAAARAVAPREINRIIRTGHESLELPTINGLGTWEKMREAEWRNLLKKAARAVGIDVRRLVNVK